jgi:hypothetical protein
MHRLPRNASCANRSMRLHHRIELPHEDLIIFVGTHSFIHLDRSMPPSASPQKKRRIAIKKELDFEQ